MATPEKNLALPLFNSLSWNIPLNTNFSQIDASLAGIQPINLAAYTGGPVVLTNTFPIVSTPLTSLSYLPLMLFCFGALSQNTVVQIPSGITGVWVFQNFCTGAYILTLASGGGGASYVVPQGVTGTFVSDGTNIFPVGAIAQGNQIGDLIFTPTYGGPRALCLLCYGQAVSRTTYAALFAVIGTGYGAGDGSTTFNVPDYRGRVLAGADNMGGVAAGRLPGYYVGAAAGAATVAQSIAQLAPHSHTDTGHTHTAADSGHVHGGSSGLGLMNVVQPFSVPGPYYTFQSGSGASGSYNIGGTGVGDANITVSYGNANLTSTGLGQPSSVVQPTQAVSVYIYAGA
jgi:microcystin-dependent protein